MGLYMLLSLGPDLQKLEGFLENDLVAVVTMKGQLDDRLRRPGDVVARHPYRFDQ